MEIHNYSEGEQPLTPEEYDELHPTPGYKPRNPKKRLWLKILIALILLAALGFGAYKLFFNSKPSITPTNQPTVTSDQITENGLRSYVSPASSQDLEFKYPASWSVSPPSGQGGDTITAISPIVSLSAANGSSKSARIIFQIRADNTTISELASAAAVAAQDSVQYAYDAPTKIQHTYFYVSFLHLGAAADNHNGFEEVAITGSHKVTKGSAITADTLRLTQPLITAQFVACSDGTCNTANQTPLSVNDATWQGDPSLQQLLAIFQSLQFR
jgi:hypothetical protein